MNMRKSTSVAATSYDLEGIEGERKIVVKNVELGKESARNQ